MDKKGRRTKSAFALMCTAILCVIAIIAMSAITGEIDNGFLTVNTTSQITVLGDNATYLITIKNTGNETDTFNLTAINIDNASVAVLNQSEITLGAGQNGNITLIVGDDDVIGPYCVLVNATSQISGLSDEVETTTAVVEEWEE